ncbi:SDR family oxidoreductase [Micromonospora sp. CA-269861]|uniref:SDR family oxidoreductase n=1 Tax=Micromonospora sp. CA-269861 TaxID=3239968 RepID=UPI003D90761B
MADQASGTVVLTGATSGIGEPDDIARIVLFFASDDSRFVTGSEVAGDGGQVAGQADYQGLPQ